MKPLYYAALDLPEKARAQFIIEACGNELELRKELTALLEATETHPGSDETVATVNLRHVLPQESTTFTAGELLLGRFRIVRLLGGGGMGEVYEALDLELGRIALKTIRTDIANNTDVLARFKKKVQLARKTSGAHICRICELFIDADSMTKRPRAFLTMEYLEGITLADKLHESGRFPWRDARSIALEICDGLQTIHGAGIINRDLKSRNIMLVPRNGSTSAVLMDFGLAASGSYRLNLSTRKPFSLGVGMRLVGLLKSP